MVMEMERAKKCTVLITGKGEQEAAVLEFSKNAYIVLSLIHPLSGALNTIKLRWNAPQKIYSGLLGAWSIQTKGPVR